MKMATTGEKHGQVVITCDDILEFQESLKKMRLIDDRIIHALNTSIPTSSFAGQVSAAEQCKLLYGELERSYSQREVAVKKCISQVSNKVNSLKQQRIDDMDNLELMKTLRKQQSNLRLMQAEVNVEEVIKDRSLKVFYERCRTVYKPSSMPPI